MNLVNGLSILFIFSKNQLLVSLILGGGFVSISFISTLIFIMPFLLVSLCFVCCSFSRVLGIKLDCLFEGIFFVFFGGVAS